MSWQEEIASLINEQEATDDRIRLYYDGSICVPSLTASGQIGWMIEAPSVPGAALITTRIFNGYKYLKCDSMRQAIMLRDAISFAPKESRKKTRALEPSYDML